MFQLHAVLLCVLQTTSVLSIIVVAILSARLLDCCSQDQRWTTATPANKSRASTDSRHSTMSNAVTDSSDPLCPSIEPVVSFTSSFNLSAPLDLTRQLSHNRTHHIHLVAYATKKFGQSRLRIQRQAETFSFFDTISILGPDDLSPAFAGYFRRILSLKRGAGYWIWKAWIIREALQRVDFGHFVMYTDSGSTIGVGKGERLGMLAYMSALETSEYGVLCYDSPYKESTFSSGRIIDAFGVRHSQLMLSSNQIWAGFMLFRKQENVLNMMDKIIGLLFTDAWIITDHYGSNGSMPDFKENRHDQSIFSLAFKCHGVVIARHYKPFPAMVLPTRIKKA